MPIGKLIDKIDTCIKFPLLRRIWASLCVVFLLMWINPYSSFAGTEKVLANSLIIDMGRTPQGIGNGLKPYGLVYDLVSNYNVPIKWVINPAKGKDGIDFSHNGRDYRGGPFIIPNEFRSPGIDLIVQSWEMQGIEVDTVVSTISVPVDQTVTYFPVWTLDLQNGSIAEDYFVNAGIPPTSYTFKEPYQLDSCDDVFIMPHADPTWATHQNLLDWNAARDSGGAEGWIWANCHAVSVLESLFDPMDPTRRMDFLTENGAVSYKVHANGTTPYTYKLHADPIMQFIGTIDLATSNGSEQIYMPMPGGWRPSTQIGVCDPDHPDIPGITPGEAAPLAFGYAFGNPDNGRVKYVGGHSLNKGAMQSRVAAQRSFFNFAFQAVASHVAEPVCNIPDQFVLGVPFTLEVSEANGRKMKDLTIEWSAGCAGTFSSTTDSIVTFTATSITSDCFFLVTIYDDCNRPSFCYNTVRVDPNPQPPQAQSDSSTTPPYYSSTVNVLLNDFDPNYDSMFVSSLLGPNPTVNNGSFVNNNDGTVTYTPDPTYLGPDQIDYVVCDTSGRCDTAVLFFDVSYPDTDNDGVTDQSDIDDDNDGVRDVDEGNGTDPSADADADALPNFLDPDFAGFVDVNADQINDNFDADLDGIADHLDLDADNDGVPDAIEANNGATHASYTATSATISGAVGANGWPDAVDNIETANAVLPNPDTDGDGRNDLQDVDSDGDGITDVLEAGGTDADQDARIDGFTDTDSDGIHDDLLTTPLSNPNTDSDAYPYLDYVDIDADDDGIIDNIEAQSTAGYTSPAGSDTDGDGLDNAYDPDNGGSYIVPYDHDGDGTADYIDTDSDNDLVDDRIEANDTDSNNVADFTFAGTDTDGDGLDDAFDPDQIVCTYTDLGQSANGGCAALQDFDGLQDRDWRDDDDDEDRVLTKDEIPDANTNGQPDYLEPAGNCVSPEILVIDYNIDTLPSLSVCSSTGVSNTDSAVGMPDNQFTGLLQSGDYITVNFASRLPTDAVLWICGSGTGTVTVRRNSGIPSCNNSGVTLDGSFSPSGCNSIQMGYGDSTIVIYGNATANVQIDAIFVVKDSTDCINPKPVAADDSYTTFANHSLALNVLANDFDPLNDTLIFSGFNLISPGVTVEVNPDQTLQFYPTANSAGLDSFEYIICGSLGDCDTALVVVAVEASGCAQGLSPILVLDTLYGDSIIQCRVDDNNDNTICDPEVLGIPDDIIFTSSFKRVNDSVIIKLIQPIPVAITTPTLNIFVSDGEWNTSPGVGLEVSVSLDNSTYMVIDSLFKPASAISVTYGSTFNTYKVSTSIEQKFEYVKLKHLGASGDKVNVDAIEIIFTNVSGCMNSGQPTALNDNGSGNINDTVNIAVLSNDFDIWGDTLVLSSVVSGPNQGGTASIQNNGSVDYVPPLDWVGADTFTYAVCDTHSSAGSSVSRKLSSSTDDAEQTISLTNTSATATFNNFGEVSPSITDSNLVWMRFSGLPIPRGASIDSAFLVVICDESGSSNADFWILGEDEDDVSTYASGQLTDKTETIARVNWNVGTTPWVDDGVYTSPDLSSVIAEITGRPGWASGNAIALLIKGSGNRRANTYDADPLDAAVLNIYYSTGAKCDTASVFVTISNAPPVASADLDSTEVNTSVIVDVTINDSDPDGGNLSVDTVLQLTAINGSFAVNSDSTISYFPEPDFVGVDSFLYIVCDDQTPQACDTATVTVVVTPFVNDPPIAVRDSATTEQDESIIINFLSNDIEPESQGIIPQGIVDSAVNGSLIYNPLFGAIYQPDLAFNGTDSFTYSICDDYSPPLCDTGTVFITVTGPVNDPPDANTDYANGYHGCATVINVIANDVDEDGNVDPATASLVTPASNGTVVNNGDGTFDYTPTIPFTGLDSFEYSVCDDGFPLPSQCSQAKVYVTVYATNQDPVAVDDYDTANVNISWSILVTDNDSDPEGEALIPDTGTILPSNGTIEVFNNGIIVYTPDSLFVGTDSFNYYACDQSCDQKCVLAMVYVYVKNNPPVTNIDYLFANPDSIVELDVMANDADPDGHHIILSSAGTDASNGSTSQGGTVSVQGDTVIVYQSAPAYTGKDTFYYVVCDTQTPSLCDTNFVIVTVINEDCGNNTDDDGDGLVDCLDMGCIPGTPGTITPGNAIVCSNAVGETYSIAAVAGATSYTWSVTTGATITSGQGTTSITVDWGTVGGTVCVVSDNGFCNSPQQCLVVPMRYIPNAPVMINH